MRRILLLGGPCLLFACSGEPDDAPVVPERDPATVQALNHPIMTDPDLAGLNEANAALTGGFDHSMPPVVVTPEAIERARREAAQLVGGSDALVAPDPPQPVEASLPEASRFAILELARATLAPKPCVDTATYSANWAATMPDAAPIYPRGNVVEAAGSDSTACRLRAVRFLTPVSREDVFAFYAAQARTAGIPVEYTISGDTERMQGSKGASGFAVVVRRRASGISEVGLVTKGFAPREG